MEDRRSVNRLQVDVQLDDLQSELEAGARALERIHGDVFALDDRMRSHLEHAAVMGRLLAQIGDLKRSVTEQRARIPELRSEMRKLRIIRRASRAR